MSWLHRLPYHPYQVVTQSTPQKADMPVIVLCTATGKAPSEKRVISVPWPCETEALVERIEAALLDAQGATTAAAVPAWPS